MKTIMIANEKGGVGKTTLSVTLAAWLTRAGRVLLIDCDAQKGSATQYAGIEPSGKLFDWLVRGQFQPVVSGVGFEIISGNAETAVIPALMTDDLALQRSLVEVGVRYDYCIMDTGPTPSQLNAMVFTAAEFVILPTQLEFASFGSLVASLANFHRANKWRKQAGLSHALVIGIVPMMVDSRLVLHQTNYDALKNQYGELVFNPIANRVAWREAWQACQPVFDYAAESEAADEAIEFCKRVEEMINV